MGENLRARRVRLRLAASVLLAWLTVTPGGPAIAGGPGHDRDNCARPALWVVSDADTTIYLFGTIHTHDGRAHWFDHAVRRAFEASDELVLETIVPATRPTMASAAAGDGLGQARATIRTARTIGLSVELGADQVLHRAAQAAGKPVVALESFSEQLRMYQTLPSPTRSAAPAAAVTQPAPEALLAPVLRNLVDSWNQGDNGPIEAVVGAVRSQSPDSFRRLFSDRNASWAKWIGQRLERPGTAFVAIGTGHLVGLESVQAKLSKAGIRSARIS